MRADVGVGEEEPVPRRRKVRHQDWHAIADLPAAVRITRTATGKDRWEFADTNGVILAVQEKDELSTYGRNYKFTKGRLEDSRTNVIIPALTGLPPEETRMKKAPWNPRIALPDGSWLGWTSTRDPWSFKWNTASIKTQSGETLVTLRWLPHGLFQPWSFQQVGEAVIAPHVDSPFQQTLLTAYAFKLLDYSSTPQGTL
jgi:hypothetical protein